MKTDSFYKHRTLLNFKPQTSGCILVMAHFTAPPRDGLGSPYRVQQKVAVLWMQQKAKQVLSDSALVADRQTGCPMLWITKG